MPSQVRVELYWGLLQGLAKPPRSSTSSCASAGCGEQTCLRFSFQDHVRVSEDLRSTLSRPAAITRPGRRVGVFFFGILHVRVGKPEPISKTRRAELRQYLCWHGWACCETILAQLAPGI